MAFSLAIACSIFGARFVLKFRQGLRPGTLILVPTQIGLPRFQVEQIRNPTEAVKEADAVYTDVWASMGQKQKRGQ